MEIPPSQSPATPLRRRNSIATTTALITSDIPFAIDSSSPSLFDFELITLKPSSFVAYTSLRDILTSFPSNLPAIFHKSIGESVLKLLLRFLQRTSSPLMVNVYPYLAYKKSFPSIPLDFALFQPMNNPKRRKYTDSYSGVSYTNLFDIKMDFVDSAVKSLGLPKISVVVSEIGWPSSGDPGEVATNLENARVLNQRLSI